MLDSTTRRRAVAGRLAGYAAADVICLQEADQALFALAADTLGGFTARLLTKPARGEGCALFVSRALAPEPAFEELVFTDGSGHVALAFRNARMTVVCTHLKWEPEGVAIEAHRGRAQLAEILDRWPSGPRIVSGDFNADSDSVVLALARERELFDAYASMPAAYTCNANAQRKRIDFILHSADFIATPSALDTVIDDDTALPGAGEPSDHLAIDARLERRAIA